MPRWAILVSAVALALALGAALAFGTRALLAADPTTRVVVAGLLVAVGAAVFRVRWRR